MEPSEIPADDIGEAPAPNVDYVIVDLEDGTYRVDSRTVGEWEPGEVFPTWDDAYGSQEQLSAVAEIAAEVTEDLEPEEAEAVEEVIEEVVAIVDEVVEDAIEDAIAEVVEDAIADVAEEIEPEEAEAVEEVEEEIIEQVADAIAPLSSHWYKKQRGRT